MRLLKDTENMEKHVDYLAVVQDPGIMKPKNMTETSDCWTIPVIHKNKNNTSWGTVQK